MLACRSGHADVWRSTWSVDREYQSSCDGVWDVVYDNLGEVPDPELRHPSVESAIEQLSGALDAIHQFASAHKTGHWGELFAAARELLTTAEPTVPYYDQLLPDRGLQHTRLTAALAESWVFGGMGSWNDLGFGEPDVAADYQAVTRDLYAAVMTAVDAVTNR